MKKILTIILFITLNNLSFATNQMPDYLMYNDDIYILETGWGFPSIIQTYYQQKNMEYPFTMLGTNNYRGHIAYWEINDNKLILRKLKVGNNFVDPQKYGLKSKNIINEKGIFADWFSGVLHCLYYGKNKKRPKKNLYLEIKKGKVINQLILDKPLKKLLKKERKKIKKIKDTIQRKKEVNKFIENLSLIWTYQKYVSYYFRLLSKNDSISINNKGGYFIGNNGISPILLYFENDSSKWPYNWENKEKSGAPNGEWEIIDNKLYLKKINLISGTSFMEIDKNSIKLEDIFKNKVTDNKVIGDWITGIYAIKIGKDTSSLFKAYPEFKLDYIILIRLEKGNILEKYVIKEKLDFNNLPENIEPGLKKLLMELGKTGYNILYSQ